MMKKIFNPLVLIICSGLLLIFSCEKDKLSDNTCNVKNPLEDLAWMKNDINFIEQLDPSLSQYITISMAKYNGETVFFSIYCDPAVEPVYPIRNCSGETIGYWGEILPEELTDQKEIWRSEYCICN